MSPDEAHEKLSDETHAADRRDARKEHVADRPPTEQEERAAEDHDVDPDAARAYREQAERGARTRGEGRIP
ncbi:MAG: hypothetical protein M5U14_16000 [Acidimicrobiia bacterium]|nr:hypothetical protein [Acidimicrobiia bacterium]